MGNFKNRFRYFKEKRMSVLILLFLLAINVLIILIGCLVLKLLPENRGLSMSDALWESLKLILDPGGFLGNKLSAVMTIVTSIIVLLGTITFTGGIIGYVSNMITERIDKSNRGVGGLKFEDFTLILNWNEKALAIILERTADKKRDNKNDYIVVLAEKDKQELEAYIDAQIKDYCECHSEYNSVKPKVIVRNGNPREQNELDNVGYEGAKLIYIMQPDDSSAPDYDVMRTYFCLAERNEFGHRVEDDLKLRDGLKESFGTVSVVVETSDYRVSKGIEKMKLMSVLNREYITSVIYNDFVLGKIYAQLAIMPSLCDAYKEILSLAGSTFCLYAQNGKAYSAEEEMKSCKYAIPICDTEDDDGNQTRLYLTGEDIDAVEYYDFERHEPVELRNVESIEKIVPDLSADTHTIIICGCSRKLRYILESIKANNETYYDRSCNVKFVVTAEKKGEIMEYAANDRFKGMIKGEPVIISNYLETDAILAQIDDDFRSMLVLSDDSADKATVDKNVFETWMGISGKTLQNEELKGKLSGKIVLEVSNISNARLFEDESCERTVISNQFVSMFMAQTAEGGCPSIILDMLSTAKDQDFRNLGIMNEDACDLLAVKAGKFFNTDRGVIFESKLDCIWTVYHATEGRYVPIGCVVHNGTYLFTNGKEFDVPFEGLKLMPDITDGILVSGMDGGMYGGGLNEEEFEALGDRTGEFFEDMDLEMEPDDYIIVVKKGEM